MLFDLFNLSYAMLKRVSIQNFKSLKDVTLDLQKVNLLIGPNNSGKTNFLKVFNFLYLYFDGLKNIADSAHYRKDDANSINIHLVFDEFTNQSINDKYRHIIFQKVLDYRAHEDYGIRFGRGPNLNFDKINFSENNDPGIDLILDYVGDVIVYRPDPNLVNKSGPLSVNNRQIDAYCSNLIAFFDYIRDQHFDIFLQIQKDLSSCIPEFNQINFRNTEPSEEQKKIFGERTFKKIGLSSVNDGIIYWADELSEGTLYFIALLCIINQPNPPKLLLLEEPEKGIHPRRIHEVIQFIFRLAEEKDIQVVMTTHSPTVLDMFAEMPESVFIFDKDEDGATHVKNLQQDVIEPDIQKSKELGIEPPRYTDALGDSWTVGFLGGVPK